MSFQLYLQAYLIPSLSAFIFYSLSLTIYIGLFFVSKYVFDKYNPIIPRHSNWIPPKKNIIVTNDGHPATGSPNANALIIITNIEINESRTLI